MSIENYWKSRWRYYWRWSGPRVAYVDVRSLLPGMPEARTHLTAHCCFKCKWLSHGRLVTVSHTLSNISSLLLPKESSPSKPPTEGITFSLFPKLLWASDSPWPPFPLNFDTALASTLLCLYSVFSHSWPWPLCIGGGALDCHNCRKRLTTISLLPDWPDRFCYICGFTVYTVSTNCQYKTTYSSHSPIVSPFKSIDTNWNLSNSVLKGGSNHFSKDCVVYCQSQRLFEPLIFQIICIYKKWHK